MNRIELNDGRDFLLWREGSGKSVEIFDIAVNTKRGIGVGTRLISLLRGLVGKGVWNIYAITRASNFRAHDFYRKNGFVRTGTLLHFYVSESEDAVVYSLRLK